MQLTTGQNKKYLTLKEVAEATECPKKTVINWIRRGYLPAYKFGGNYRIDRKEFEAWKENQRAAA